MTLAALWLLALDRLRACRLARTLAACGCAGRATLGAGGALQSVEDYCRAIRLRPDSPAARRWEAAIHRRLDALGQAAWPPGQFDAAARSRRLEKAVLLKAPVSAREPGVLYVAFEHQWLRLLSLPALAEFAREYTLVLAPSWSPPHRAFNYHFPRVYPAPVFCQISHPDDVHYWPRLSPRYRVVPLMASHWVNPDWFAPRPADGRDVDLVMVANFARFKRHAALFAALRELPRDWRVVLLGQREAGRTAADVRAEAAAFGVADRFELRESVPHQEVCGTLCRARASVVLSRREGACVVVAESLFADTPVGLPAGAQIGSAQFINDQTGCLLRDGPLAPQLRALVEQAPARRPRAWALAQGISCHASTRRLNELLRAAALAEGREWTTGLAPLHWRPNPELVDAEDAARLAPARRRLEEQYGLQLGPVAQ